MWFRFIGFSFRGSGSLGLRSFRVQVLGLLEARGGQASECGEDREVEEENEEKPHHPCGAPRA